MINTAEKKHKSLFTIIGTSLLFFFSSSMGAVTTPTPEQVQQKKQAFIERITQEYSLSTKEVSEIINQINYIPSIIKSMTRPYEKSSWSQYRKHFITSQRINDSEDYLKKHKQSFSNAQKKYGVDSHTIAAIIAIETNLGRHKGSYKVLDSLGTLAFYYPKREQFFQDELAKFIELTKINGLPIDNIKGSYAGAIGIPQFMPSSYLAYGISEQNPHHVDLYNNDDDAILSIANYLKHAHWETNQPAICKATISSPSVAKKLVSTSAKPQHSLAWYQKQGVKTNCLNQPDTTIKASLINLNDKDSAPNYWIVFNNFSSILRYNPRHNYAMAVAQLSNAIATRETNG